MCCKNYNINDTACVLCTPESNTTCKNKSLDNECENDADCEYEYE